MQQQSLNEQLWPDQQRHFGCGAQNRLGPQLRLRRMRRSLDLAMEATTRVRELLGDRSWGVPAVALDEPAGTAASFAFRRGGDQQPFAVSAEYAARVRAAAGIGQPVECSARTMSQAIVTLVEAKLGARGSEMATVIGRYVSEPNEARSGAVAVTTAGQLP